MRVRDLFHQNTLGGGLMRATIVPVLLLAAVMTTPAIAGALRGCFARSYDKMHLAQHPDQIVTAVKLRIYPSPSDANTSWFSIWMKRRGEYKALHNEGICELSGVVTMCYVECNGGGIRVAPRSSATVLMRFGSQPSFGPNGEPIKQDEGIRMTPCGTEDVDDGSSMIVVTGGKDDHEFLLYQVDETACIGIN